MNASIGCELRRDEFVVKLFQVLSIPRRGSESVRRIFPSSLCNNRVSNNNVNSINKSHSRSRSESGSMDRERGRRRAKTVGILSRSLLSVMEDVDVWRKCIKSTQPICVISKYVLHPLIYIRVQIKNIYCN